MKLLEGMRFVITGAAQGIGAATATMAASRGAKVVVADVDDAVGKRTVSDIVAQGGDATFFHCDVTDADQVQGLMKFASDTYGGIDVLHNNAGVHEGFMTSDLTIETLPQEIWDRVLAINLRGPWLCSRHAVPFLKQSSFPSIINAGSISSWLGFPGSLAYGPSKGGIAQLTRVLAVELARYQIRVNCYCPSTIRTRMGNLPRDAVANYLTNTHLVRRMGEPEEVASLVCFLASKEAAFINGVVWLIDGGSLAWRGTGDVLGFPPITE